MRVTKRNARREMNFLLVRLGSPHKQTRKKTMKNIGKSLAVAGIVLATAFCGSAFADSTNKECPVQSVSGKSFDEEFGAGASEMTRCIENRKHVKVVYQINQFCEGATVNGVCTKAYALGNINNAIKDYEVSYGMVMGEDVEIAVVVHGGGANMVVQDAVLRAHGKGTNPFENDIRALIGKGVKVYMCQNTARSLIKNGTLTAGYATSELIDGVQFVTAGVTAIPDFQSLGYEYIQP
jgi:intracellular sulfur oxidation DsrE/DsrF family protein